MSKGQWITIGQRHQSMKQKPKCRICLKPFKHGEQVYSRHGAHRSNYTCDKCENKKVSVTYLLNPSNVRT